MEKDAIYGEGRNLWRRAQRMEKQSQPTETAPGSPDPGSSDPYAAAEFTIQPEDLWPEEWVEWFYLTPQQRWEETEKLWAIYLTLGGSLDPEPDTQSPFYDPETSSSGPADGRPGVHIIRRSGV